MAAASWLLATRHLADADDPGEPLAQGLEDAQLHRRREGVGYRGEHERPQAAAELGQVDPLARVR